jgi:hypothetical protein
MGKKKSKRRRKASSKRKASRRRKQLLRQDMDIVHRDPVAESLIFKSGDGTHKDKKKDQNKKACRVSCKYLLEPT